MLKSKTKLIVVFALTLAIFVALIIRFYLGDQNAQTSSEADTNPLVKALTKILEAKKATKSDWESAKINTIRLGDASLPIHCGILTGLHPIFEAESNLSPANSKLLVERKNEEIITGLWSHKANNKVVVNWKTNSIRAEKPKWTRSLEFSEKAPGSQLSAQFGANPKDKKPCIAIAFPKEDNSGWVCREIPYEHQGYDCLWAFVPTDYPIAVLPKVRLDSYKLVGILILDTANAKLLGEIEMPSVAVSSRPNFVLDMENDVLVGLAFNLDWLLAVDLKPYMDKLRKEGWKPPITAPPEKQAAQP